LIVFHAVSSMAAIAAMTFLSIRAVTENQAPWRIAVPTNGDGPSAAVCCNYINFFARRSAAATWAAAHPEVTGGILSEDRALQAGEQIFGELLREIRRQSAISRPTDGPQVRVLPASPHVPHKLYGTMRHTAAHRATASPAPQAPGRRSVRARDRVVRLHLAAEGKAATTVRTSTEAVAWFAAAHLILHTDCTSWDQVTCHDVQRWLVHLLIRYSDA
jgi:hypothetical protein